ncbi:MAG: hypothetical protein ACI4I9_08750 [Porcipelethomonas sp.]
MKSESTLSFLPEGFIAVAQSTDEAAEESFCPEHGMGFISVNVTE